MTEPLDIIGTMLKVSPQIFNRFPGVRIGTLVVQNLDNSSTTFDLSREIAEASQALRDTMSGLPVIEHPNIACWETPTASSAQNPSTTTEAAKIPGQPFECV